jgi:hypothetical protein
MRYYKQRFGLPRAVTVARNQKAVGRVLQQYRALGWMGSTGTPFLYAWISWALGWQVIIRAVRLTPFQGKLESYFWDSHYLRILRTLKSKTPWLKKLIFLV